MTIDEAIIQFKEDAEYNRADLDLSWAEENEQVAKWLEELKTLRELKKTYAKGMETSYAEFRYKQGRADEQDRMLSIVSRCIANNVYNVSEGIALLNEIKEELKEKNNGIQ